MKAFKYDYCSRVEYGLGERHGTWGCAQKYVSDALAKKMLLHTYSDNLRLRIKFYMHQGILQSIDHY